MIGKARRCNPAWLLALWPAAAMAQGGVQNMDIYLGFGGTPIQAQTAPGGQYTLSGSVEAMATLSYGYQISHWSKASLWIEFPFSYGASHHRISVLPGNTELDTTSFAPGLRLMFPVQSHVSVYGSAGGGFGSYSVPPFVIQRPYQDANSPTQTAFHGVFEFDGGVDYRVNRRFSFRVQVRDYVTGHGLSGVAGRNHMEPTAGLAYHF